MSGGLLLHISGPLQSWGGTQGGRVNLTHPYPTRSALIGLLAAAQGRPRDADLTDLSEISITLRIDRPGVQHRDFQTIGGGYSSEKTVMTASGIRRKSALIRERWYMSDAAYSVALTGPTDLLTDVGEALVRPVFDPYLGRRSCPPDSPLYIAAPEDPVAELEHLPIHRPRPRGDDESVEVLLVRETRPHDGAPPTRDINDTLVPGRGRSWTTRPVWEIPLHLPGNQCAGRGAAWIRALSEYRSALENRKRGGS